MRAWRSRSGFRAAFFSAVLLWCSLVPGVQAHSLSDHPVWRALIHWRESGPSITGDDFLLSAQTPSPEAELNASVRRIWHGPPDKGLCRYPARYAWLKAQLDLPTLDLQQCPEVQEFLTRAPADQLSLVFASENLAQPSSMMGHLFLKLEGRDAQSRAQAHAVSFFTDAATWNLPRLLVESILIGKPGYFTLTPFEQERRHYIDVEGRTLWDFPLQLSADQRQWISLHLLELRRASLTYFFHRYNCASLIQDLLAIAEPDVLNAVPWATTPKDVLRAAHKAGLLADPMVHSPPRWLLRTLRPALSEAERQAIEGWLLSPDEPLSLPEDEVRAFLVWQAARARVAWHRSASGIPTEAASRMSEHLASISRPAFADLDLHALQRQSPLNAPPDRRWTLGVLQDDDTQWVTLGAMPASHTLLDDNQTSFAENELRLFDLALAWSPRRSDLRVQHLTIYGTRSMLPWDEWTGGLSGQFRLGWERQRSARGSALAPTMAGGLGWTARLGQDVDAYAVASMGLAWKDGPYLYAEPTVGGLVRMLGGMKALVECRWTSTDWTREPGGTRCEWTQAIPLTPGWRLDATARLTGERSAADWHVRLVGIR
jgi:Domain of unknown function (DUF4105)